MLKEFSHLRSASVMKSTFSLHKWLNEDMLPTGLQSLKLTCAASLFDGTPFVSLAKCLPNLTSLEIVVKDAEALPKLLHDLPKTLTLLRVKSCEVFLATLATLPPTLLHLDANLRIVMTTPASSATVIPYLARTLPALEVLTNMEIRAQGLPNEVDLQWTSKLPHCLRSLKIVGDCTHHFIAALPPTIEELHILQANFGWEAVFKASLLDDNRAINPFDLKLPPMLQRLSIRLNTLPQGLLRSLPSTLKELSIILSTKSHKGVFCADALPRHLEYLMVDQCYICPPLHIEGVLPGTLQTLAVKGPMGSENTEIFGWNRPSSPESPPMAESRLLGSCKPPLRKLKVEKWLWSWFLELPRTLTSLDIRRLFDLPKGKINASHLADLPETLTLLRVRQVTPESGFFLSRNTFSRFRFLQTLRFSFEIPAPSSICRYLPTSLTSIELNLSLEDDIERGRTLEEAAAQLLLLPPHLKVCKLGKAIKISHTPSKKIIAFPVNLKPLPTVETMNDAPCPALGW